MAISVNTMRAIDHWVGVPLCAIVSPFVAVVDGIKNVFSRGPETPKKLLFIELSEMGSAILVDPAMRNAQARGAEIFFLIFKSNRASLTLLNTVKPENIFTIDSSSFSGLIKDTLRFLVLARYHRIDAVIDFRAVFQQTFDQVAYENMPSLLKPKTGKLDLQDHEKVFCVDHKGLGDIFDMRGINREKGCMIVVRPDQYVSHVLPLDGFEELSAFFAGVLQVNSAGKRV